MCPPATAGEVDAAMDAIWILLEDQRYGPYPPAQVAAMLADGTIPADADVWWPPVGAWVKASELHVADRSPAALQPAGAGAPTAAFDPGAGAGALAGPAPATGGVAPAAAASEQVVVHPVPAEQHLGRRLPTRPAPPHRHRPQLPTPEHAEHVGRPDPANPWAFTAVAAAVAALSVCWWAPLATVATVFAVVAFVVGAGVVVLGARGEPGRRMAATAMVIAAAAVALPLSLGAILGSSEEAAPVVAETASSPVKVTLGAGMPAKGTTVLQAQVYNSGDRQVDGGLFTVEATVKGGVVGQATQTLPALQAGGSGTARVVFLQTLPADAEYRVTKVTTLPL